MGWPPSRCRDAVRVGMRRETDSGRDTGPLHELPPEAEEMNAKELFRLARLREQNQKIPPERVSGGVRITGKRRPYWLGEWRERATRQPDGTWNYRHRARNLGFCDEVTEQEARAKLDCIVSGTLVESNLKHRAKSHGAAGRHGAAAEMLACCDLLQKGYEVYRSVNGGAPCDLVALKDGKFQRVEVKLCDVTAAGRPVCDLRSKVGQFDMLVVVTLDGRILYRQHDDVIIVDSAQSVPFDSANVQQ